MAAGRAAVTKADYKRALEDISRYVLPTSTFDGEKFVRLEYADRLRKMAKEALTGREPST